MIWNTSELSALYLSRATAIFVVDGLHFSPSWFFWLKMELMACVDLVGGTTEKICLFPDPIWYYKWYETFPNCMHYTSAVSQPFLLLIAANLDLAGFLGWKWSLWPVPTWLAVQRSKALFFLTLYDSINDNKYFRNCLHHTAALSQPFLLLIAANLAQAGFLGWKWSLWYVLTWLAVQRRKAVFFQTLDVIINDMK